MARFITVQVQCDVDTCEITAEENSGEVVEKTLSIDGKAPKAFLLCKMHLGDFDEFIQPLMSAGIKIGSTTKSTTPAAVESAGAIECKACGRALKNRAGLAQHVIRSHNYENLAAYTAAYPN